MLKLTAQVKLLPSPQQAAVLLRTLETANAAANRLSQLAWDSKQLRQFDIHRTGYHQIREEFPLSAQVVVRLIAKVADAYKLRKGEQRIFRQHGSIAYDARVLSWKSDAVSIWTLAGRIRVPFA